MTMGAGTRAGPHGFPWKTRLLTAFNTVGGAEPEAAPARLHCWSRVTKAHSAIAGTAHAAFVSLQCQLDTTARFRYYDACMVASTGYAASYTTSMGASPMGQKKSPLAQRVYKAMKRIWQEILRRCTTISIYLV